MRHETMARWIAETAAKARWNVEARVPGTEGWDGEGIGYLADRVSEYEAQGRTDTDEHRALQRLAKLPGACGLCARIGTNALGGPRAHAPGCPNAS